MLYGDHKRETALSETESNTKARFCPLVLMQPSYNQRT